MVRCSWYRVLSKEDTKRKPEIMVMVFLEFSARLFEYVQMGVFTERPISYDR